MADEATAAEVGLSVDKGDVRVGPAAAAEVGLPVDDGDARVGPAAAAELGLQVDKGDVPSCKKTKKAAGHGLTGSPILATTFVPLPSPLPNLANNFIPVLRESIISCDVMA